MNSAKKIREPTKARKAQEVNFKIPLPSLLKGHWYRYNTNAPLDYLEVHRITVEALGLSQATAEALGIGNAPKGLLKGCVAIPVRLPSGEFRLHRNNQGEAPEGVSPLLRGYISKIAWAAPRRDAGLFYSNRRCGSSLIQSLLIRLDHARWEQACSR
jgi:hypothetical protein